MIIRLRGKLIEQSEAGKCLVIGTIMADRLIIKQQKISVLRRENNSQCSSVALAIILFFSIYEVTVIFGFT